MAARNDAVPIDDGPDLIRDARLSALAFIHAVLESRDDDASAIQDAWATDGDLGMLYVQCVLVSCALVTEAVPEPAVAIEALRGKLLSEPTSDQ